MTSLEAGVPARMATPGRVEPAPRGRRSAGRRIAIACGGTAGHVYPALAVASAYQQLHPGTEILFLGTAAGSEATLVPAHGHRLVTVRAAPFFGSPWLRRAGVLVEALRGAAQAVPVLRDFGAELVFGSGNYATAGALLAARWLGLPSVVQELNAKVGMTNRAMGRLASRALLGFESAPSGFGPVPTSFVGVPVRRAVLASRARASRAPGEPFRVLVSGGSVGSEFLDTHVPELLGRVAAAGHQVEVRHQVGLGDVAATRAAYEGLGLPATVVPTIDAMESAYAWADFAVVSGGAATLAELSSVGLPALVVPFVKAALDHQAANAKAFSQATGTRWTRESEWDPQALAAYIGSLIASPSAWKAASEGVRKLARPRAAEAVVEACETVLRASARTVALEPTHHPQA